MHSTAGSFGLGGACLHSCMLDGDPWCPQAESPSMLPIPTSRPPRHPIGPRRLHRTGHKGIPRSQEIPTVRDLQFAVLWVPWTLSCVIHVKVEPGQIDFSHPTSLAHNSEASPPPLPRTKPRTVPRNADIRVIGGVSAADLNGTSGLPTRTLQATDRSTRSSRPVLRDPGPCVRIPRTLRVARWCAIFGDRRGLAERARTSVESSQLDGCVPPARSRIAARS